MCARHEHETKVAVAGARVTIMATLLAFVTITAHAGVEDPERVRPSTGTVGKLRQASADAAATIGEHLDRGHDWLYRRLQQFFEAVDLRFAAAEQAPIVVPLSPLRIGFDSEFVHRQNGLGIVATPDFEATLQLPNLEQRFKIFVTSADLPEAPGDPTEERNPLRIGARFVPRSHISFEFGVRVNFSPSAFGAIKWAPEFDAGTLRINPFIKTYVESGLGLGTSGGVALERWSDRWVVRSASYANWVHNTAATDWSQSLLIGYARAVIQARRYDRFATGHDLACGVAARVSVSGDRTSRTSLYEASVLMKRPLHGGWLFGYVEPVVQWDRKFQWHPDIGARIGFDALFWGLASLPSEVATYCR
jgi:hypothetical protein